jgi:hypothetical protein
MAADIPWGQTWSSGTGRLFFLTHHLFYKILGVGPFQARLVSFLGGWLLLFLVYRWARRYVSAEAALFCAALLSASPSWWMLLADVRQDMLHCTASFLAFYFLSSGALSKKNVYFLTGAFFAAISVDINYRGIEIVMCAFLFILSLPDRSAAVKRLIMFLAGSILAFIPWFMINVVPMGISNFIHYSFVPALWGEGSYDLSVLLSEGVRFIRYTALASHLAKIEIAYWIALLVLFYRYRTRYPGPGGVILRWVVITFIVMSLIERTTYPVYVLLYSPFICILCGMALYELFKKNRPVAWCIFAGILVCGLACQAIRAGKYYYHEYVVKDYSPERFYEKLHGAVEMDKGILGDVANWYAFKDARYYGGLLYLGRVKDVLGEFRDAGYYKNANERAVALLGVFKRRGIEYIIANGPIKDYIAEYFSGNNLPRKNFTLVASAEDYFLGEDAALHPVKTEIYRIISYEP